MAAKAGEVQKVSERVMNHGSLFSGIGGFDLAAQWMGWTNVFHCEKNPFGQKVLKYYWPESISYDNITTTDFTIHRGHIDILTGGFPCQPFSAAGKRKGTADDRHLWPQMLRAIREIQPRYVVGENVRGLTNWNGGMVFDQVQADLEAEGYEVIPFLLPACAVNAPHRRDRIFFVAHRQKPTGLKAAASLDKWEEYIINNGDRVRDTSFSISSIRPTSDTGNKGLQRQNGVGMERSIQSAESTSSDTDSGQRCEGGMHEARSEKATGHSGPRNTWAGGGVWENFPTQPPVCSRDDGIPGQLDGITFSKWRNESIMAYGNAIVPQVVFQIFKAIEQTNNAPL